MGIDPLFAIRRLPGSDKKLTPFAGDLRPRPLRLLFMACAPTDQATLDYEREEEALFRAVSSQEVAFDSCDLGTFEELKERVSEYRPHIRIEHYLILMLIFLDFLTRSRAYL